jgi:DNA-nicking Smr family endonuclease
MGRRGRETGRDAPREALNAPFADLRKRLPPRAPDPPPRPAAPPAEPDPFATAMQGVVPLRHGPDARVEVPRPARVARRPVSEEAEALAVLSDLVEGAANFDISDTREYVEGSIVGLDPRVLRRLRRGDYAWQDHLDLHGMTSEAARVAVDRFLAEAVSAGHRCVLIVHGRGHNSKDQTPVLKERLKSWLARGRAARTVLAFTSARPYDGGAGALYVLLRRDRKRRPIQVIEGAKR